MIHYYDVIKGHAKIDEYGYLLGQGCNCLCCWWLCKEQAAAR